MGNMTLLNVSVDWCMGRKGNTLKECGRSLYKNVDTAIKKNTFESVLMRWMKQEPIIQSEVSQKEKHQYSILTHIYGI